MPEPAPPSITAITGSAWKLLDFPDEATPILSLKILLHSAGNYVLFAGTEAQGLFRSLDEGQSWQKATFPATSLNALVTDPHGDTLLAATDKGVLQSGDAGETWTTLVELPDVLTLVASKDLVMAGFGDQGVWTSTDRSHWQPVPDLPLRSLLGLVISNQFITDGTAYMYGPEEGIWKTSDGGRSWNDLGENLPSLEINSLALSPDFSVDKTLVAASNDGLLITQDGGAAWNPILDSPAQLAAFSPNGRILVAFLPGEGILTTDDLGETWHQLAGPWDSGGQVQAIAVTNLHYFYVAHIDGLGENLTLWQGKADHFEKILSEPVEANPHVAFWFPFGPAVDRPWFVSLGRTIWKISSRSGDFFRFDLPAENGDSAMILNLTGTQDASDQVILFANTGQSIYQFSNSRDWNKVFEFGDERAVSIALSPTFQTDRTAFALLLGGSFCKIQL